MTPRCSHRSTYYYLAVNEDGWKCVDCGKGLGFRPDLDRELIETKVHGILHDMVDAKIVYVSNGTMGDIIACNVTVRCRELGMFDQYTIARLILEDDNLAGHGPFWKQKAEELLRRRGLRAVKPRKRRGGPTLWQSKSD